MEKSDSVVIIPTYNEKENIENIIRAVIGLKEHAFHIFVIDDGSPDGTADIVKRLMVMNSSLRWTLTLATLRKTFPASTTLVPTKATTCQ